MGPCYWYWGAVFPDSTWLNHFLALHNLLQCDSDFNFNIKFVDLQVRFPRSLEPLHLNLYNTKYWSKSDEKLGLIVLGWNFNLVSPRRLEKWGKNVQQLEDLSFQNILNHHNPTSWDRDINFHYQKVLNSCKISSHLTPIKLLGIPIIKIKHK